MVSQTLSKRLVVLAVVALLVLATGPTVIAAQDIDATQETRMSGNVIVAEGDTVKSLEVMSGTVVIRGTVDGDLNGVAGSVVIADTGVVTGDLSVATGSLRIAGTVGGSVSAGTGSAHLAETGQVGEDFSVGAGSVTIDGTVGNDATVGGETISLGSTAQIGGELRYDGALSRDSGAVVGGSIVKDETIGGFGPGGVSGVTLPSIGWLDTLYGLLANLLLGAVLLLVLPGFSDRVATRARGETGRSALIGLLALIGIPFVLLLLAVTIVGIPLAVLGLFGYGLVVWIGVVYGEYAAGSWLVDQWQDEPNRWYGLIVGLLAFTLLSTIPVIGGLFVFAALLVGLGAFTSGIRGTYQRRRGSGASPTTAPGETGSSAA